MRRSRKRLRLRNWNELSVWFHGRDGRGLLWVVGMCVRGRRRVCDAPSVVTQTEEGWNFWRQNTSERTEPHHVADGRLTRRLCLICVLFFYRGTLRIINHQVPKLSRRSNNFATSPDLHQHPEVFTHHRESSHSLANNQICSRSYPALYQSHISHAHPGCIPRSFIRYIDPIPPKPSPARRTSQHAVSGSPDSIPTQFQNVYQKSHSVDQVGPGVRM